MKDPVASLRLASKALRYDDDAIFILMGPVPMDPSARNVFSTVKLYYSSLPPEVKKRIYIWTIRGVGSERGEYLTNHFLTLSNVLFALSRAEGFGLFVTEALYHSTPVVGRSVGGIRKQIEETAGGLVGNDEQEILCATKMLMENRGLRKKLGANGYERVRALFTIKQSVDVIEAELSAISASSQAG